MLDILHDTCLVSIAFLRLVDCLKCVKNFSNFSKEIPKNKTNKHLFILELFISNQLLEDLDTTSLIQNFLKIKIKSIIFSKNY